MRYIALRNTAGAEDSRVMSAAFGKPDLGGAVKREWRHTAKDPIDRNLPVPQAASA